MGSFSLFHWIIVLAVVMIIFGAGRLPRVMGDLAKGVNAFRAGLKEGDDSAGTAGQPTPTATVPPPTPPEDHRSPNRA